MIVRRLARPLLASVFVAAGIDALRHPGLRSQQAAQLLGKVPDQVPGAQSAAKDPDLFVRVNGAALLGGGVLLATGRMPRLASTVLAASIIPTTAIDHAFWDETDPDLKRSRAASSSRTSACSAACCSPPSTPRADPASCGVPSTPARRPVGRPATPSARRRARPGCLPIRPRTS